MRVSIPSMLKILAPAVKTYRKSSDYPTQEAFAEFLHVVPRTVSNAENQRAFLDSGPLLAFLDALGPDDSLTLIHELHMAWDEFFQSKPDL